MTDTYSTADLNRMLAEELSRKQRQPVRSSFFGGVVPQVSAQDAAINRPDPVERASLFPLATYPDGSTRLALPGMIAEDIPRAFTAPARAYRGEIPDEDMISEGLNFAGNMAIGGSAVPKGSAVARVAANASESAAPGALASEAGRVRAYHGTNENFTRFDPAKIGSRGLTDEGAFFFGKTPDLANAYADGEFNVPASVRSEIMKRNTTPEGKLRMSDINRELEASSEQTKAGRVIPADIDASNFGTWNMPGYRWDMDEGARLKRAIDKAKAEGRSGLTINGMEDATGIRDTQYAVWQPGNVYSSTTGSLLFENGANASAPGAIASEAARQPLPVKMEVPFYRGSANGQTAVDYNQPYWGTTDKGLASDYAKSRSGMYFNADTTPNVTPAVARFRDPLYIDAQNAGWSDIPFEGQKWNSDKLAEVAKERGHDGLVIDRLYDEGRFDEAAGLPATVAALRPGTVSSAFDPNNILYANSKSSGVPGAMVAEAADKNRFIGYRGTARDEAPNTGRYWASSDQDVAQKYAEQKYERRGGNPRVVESEFRFANPLIADAKGSSWDAFFHNGQLVDSEILAKRASAAGHDGVVIKNVLDDPTLQESLTPQTTIAALKTGTVFNPKTGELIYQNGQNAVAPGVLASEASNQHLLPPSYVSRSNSDKHLFVERGYHASAGDDLIKKPKPMLDEDGELSGGPWGSSNVDVANSYSKFRAGPPSVYPLEYRFNNPKIIDAKGGNFLQIPYGGNNDVRLGGRYDGRPTTTDVARVLAYEDGHDGLVIRNVRDAAGSDPSLGTTYAPIKQGTTFSAITGDLIFENGQNVAAPGLLASEASKRVENPIRAYHGSPHDFDRFDLSKIGTGEGAQAYGHGLYFAENEAVAKSYRDGLSGNHVVSGGKIIPRAGTGKYGNLSWHSQRANLSIAEDMLAEHNGNYDRSIRDLKALKAAKTKRPDDKFITETIEDLDVAIRQLEELRAKEGSEAKSPSGKMYEVSINADPNDFLDWNVPAADQRPSVRAKLPPEWQNDIVPEYPTWTGHARTPDGMQKLREAGIPGIRYLDQGSRTAGEGSRNYVVFDDALIEILRKYMNPKTAAAPGVLMVEGSKQ